MKLASDNTAGASLEILAALSKANEGNVGSYGGDDHSHRLNQRFSDIFEKDVVVFPVVTGTAANSLALASLTPPHGCIFCHELSHIYHDEYGAPEFFTNGARLQPISGESGRITPDQLKALEVRFPPGDAHRVSPTTVSVTQLTEYGTAYSLDDLAAIGDYTKKQKLSLHMDGARFANALIGLGCTPAEMTWKCNVDVLSFGATKNGAIAAEAVIFFNPVQAESFAIRRKRSGHLLSKLRFLSAQLEAYLDNDLWLNNARQANQMANELKTIIDNSGKGTIQFSVDGNMVFTTINKDCQTDLRQAGFEFYDIPEYGKNVVRLVRSFNTTTQDISDFAVVINR
jgi:threonine aldolase